ncbi:MAG: hypothetical protein ACK554_05750 [Erythrobacteraceae bacterium]
MSPHNLLADPVNREIGDLVILDKGHQGRGAESMDGIEIEAEIAVPCAGQGAGLLLARTEGDTDPPVTGTGPDFGNLQGVGKTRSHGRQYCFLAPPMPVERDA